VEVKSGGWVGGGWWVGIVTCERQRVNAALKPRQGASNSAGELRLHSRSNAVPESPRQGRRSNATDATRAKARARCPSPDRGGRMLRVTCEPKASNQGVVL